MHPYFRTVDLADANVASAYDELPLWSARFAPLLLDNLAIRPYKRVLDVGCASGFPLFELARMFGPTCTVTGIDTWPEALERARAKSMTYGASNVDVVLADAAQMPFADATFDLIVSHLGVNNFANPQAALRECARVAKPGCAMVLVSNLYGHFTEFYNVFRKVLGDLHLDSFLDKLDAQEQHRSTVQSLEQLLTDAGFVPTRSITEMFTMRFLNGTAFLNHYLMVIGFIDGWRSILTPEIEADVFRAIESELNTRAEHAGELRLTVPMAFVEGRRP